MSLREINETACGGLGSPLVTVPELPIIANRPPSTTDFAPLGTLWDFKAQNLLWIISSVFNNTATWVPINQGAGAAVVYNVATANAVATTIATFPMGVNSAIEISANIIAPYADYSEGGGGGYIVSYLRAGAGPVKIGPAINDFQVTPGADPSLAVSDAIIGNSVVLQVTGVAATNVIWRAAITTVTLP